MLLGWLTIPVSRRRVAVPVEVDAGPGEALGSGVELEVGRSPEADRHVRHGYAGRQLISVIIAVVVDHLPHAGGCGLRNGGGRLGRKQGETVSKRDGEGGTVDLSIPRRFDAKLRVGAGGSRGEQGGEMRNEEGICAEQAMQGQ